MFVGNGWEPMIGRYVRLGACEDWGRAVQGLACEVVSELL